jgi:hypothetical protein
MTDANLVEACRQAAADYLESVVVVDDRAFLAPQPTDEQQSADQGPMVRRLSRRLATPTTGQLQRSETREHDLDAQELTRVFAEKGLICGVLSPGPAGSSDVPIDAVRRADIVVLDWNLNGDRGDAALEIISKLWDTGDTYRLRLVAVYTGERDLESIVSKIATVLRGLGPGRVRRDGDFVRMKGMLRVSVFGKAHGDAPIRARASNARSTKESDLPERLLDEFTRLTLGLVPTVALMSLAAVRQNAHRIVSRLNGTLDAPYLWHRAMLPNPDDAEDHLVDLVSAELHSIIEDSMPGRGANLDRIRLWLQEEDMGSLGQQFGKGVALQLDDVVEVLRSGADHKDATGARLGTKIGITSDGADKKKIAGFARNPTEAQRGDAELAVLFRLRTRYMNPAPRLSQGVVVAAEGGSAELYWVCLQPKCDSVRLVEPKAFPMLPLVIVSDPEKFDVVVQDNRGHQRLKLSSSPSDIKMMTFAPMPGQDAIVAQRSVGGDYRFQALEGRKTVWYRFVAELRAGPSQAMASELANNISMPGLNDSEWLRRWKKSGEKTPKQLPSAPAAAVSAARTGAPARRDQAAKGT